MNWSIMFSPKQLTVCLLFFGFSIFPAVCGENQTDTQVTIISHVTTVVPNSTVAPNSTAAEIATNVTDSGFSFNITRRITQISQISGDVVRRIVSIAFVNNPLVALQKMLAKMIADRFVEYEYEDLVKRMGLKTTTTFDRRRPTKGNASLVKTNGTRKHDLQGSSTTVSSLNVVTSKGNFSGEAELNSTSESSIEAESLLTSTVMTSEGDENSTASSTVIDKYLITTPESPTSWECNSTSASLESTSSLGNDFREWS